ncbi:cytochrome P450 [Monashia sp. NPDC004114]
MLERVAIQTDEHGQLLDAHTAGVELLNILRPAVAVARLASFAAVELLQHPDWRDRLRDEVRERGGTLSGPLATAFAQEVRRLAPFVPMLAAVTSRPTTYAGVAVPARRRVLLEVVASNRDHGSWAQPHTFDPTRFLGTGAEWSDHLVPQGGGRPESGHRCPGELVTVGLLSLTASRLALLDTSPSNGQDLGWSWRRLPTMPRSGVVLDVRPTGASLRSTRMLGAGAPARPGRHSIAGRSGSTEH